MMAKMKHTQGRLSCGVDAIIYAEDGDIVALAGDGGERARRIDVANAVELVRRWNAHADLLAALEAIVIQAGAEGYCTELDALARAAIRKAKGEA